MAMIPTKEVKAILYSLMAEKYVALQVRVYYNIGYRCNYASLGDTPVRGQLKNCLFIFSQFAAIG